MNYQGRALVIDPDCSRLADPCCTDHPSAQRV